MKKLFFILILIATFAGACKKYDEGPWLSLRSAEGRFSGIHLLTKYTIDGVDSLNSFNNTFSLLYNFKYHYDEKYGVYVCLVGSTQKDGIWSELYFGWELINNNKIFKVIECSGPNDTGPFGNSKTSEWEIIKLKYNDIRMKTTYNEKEYYIEFKRN